jgi:hypothetical protein
VKSPDAGSGKKTAKTGTATCTNVVRKPPRMKHSAILMEKKVIEILRNPNAQKQEFSSPSLQASLRCKTHAFFPYAPSSINPAI